MSAPSFGDRELAKMASKASITDIILTANRFARREP